jgi:hypothetical protein
MVTYSDEIRCHDGQIFFKCHNEVGMYGGLIHKNQQEIISSGLKMAAIFPIKFHPT